MPPRKSTRRRSGRCPLVAALLTSLALGACGQGFGSTPQLGTKSLDELPNVDNSRQSPCWQQEQIAAQNSYLASAKSGREVVFVAPCKAEKIGPAKPKDQPPRTT